MLIVLGTIVEAIAMYVIPRLLINAFPFFCVSLLICILAIARWGWKGIPVIPIVSLISVLLGKAMCSIGGYDEIKDLAKYYDWRVFITNLISFMSSLVILPIKKVLKKKEAFSDRLAASVIAAIVISICVVLQILCYSVLKANLASGSDVSMMLIMNLPAAFITLLFMAVLRHQGLFVDAKQDLIDKKLEAEAEQKYYSELRGKVIDRPGEEDDSSK